MSFTISSLIFVATRQSSSKLDSALAAPKIQFSIFNLIDPPLRIIVTFSTTSKGLLQLKGLASYVNVYI